MQIMNGTRIALVLGLAGLAGLGLATPGMLGAGEAPEACVPRPCAEPTAEAAPVSAASTYCTLTVEIVRPVAPVPPGVPGAAIAEPTAQAPVQPARTGRVIYPVERPAGMPASVPKNAATAGRSQMAPEQRKALAQKLASGQLAGGKLPEGKALPVGLSAKEEAIQRGQRMRSGYEPDASAAGHGSPAGAAAEGIQHPISRSASEAGKAEGMLIRTGKAPDGSPADPKAACGRAPIQQPRPPQ